VQTAPPATDAELEREFDGVRALLAEDNEANQMVAIELLARLGIELDVARNGREAVAMAQEAPTRYDAILMDMQMPELDGLGATRALRADPRFARMPIIAMTANAMKADLDACLGAGMNDRVTKPIDRNVLQATLRRWLPVRPAASIPAMASPVNPPVTAADAAPSSAESSPSKQAPALEGIDVHGTLQRLGIERATLERMLLRYADGQREILDALHSAVVSGDTASVARHAHALAGASGNLGAAALRTAAQALEHAAREGRTDLADLHIAVQERAAVVLRSIDGLRPAADRAADAEQPFDRALAGAALERLAVALDEYDLSSANGSLAELGRSGLPAWAAEDLGRLRQFVDGYEYAEARGIASRLLARVRDGNAA
jgi:two-component system sensor histidine kinase/response regulator